MTAAPSIKSMHRNIHIAHTEDLGDQKVLARRRRVFPHPLRSSLGMHTAITSTTKLWIPTGRPWEPETNVLNKDYRISGDSAV